MKTSPQFQKVVSLAASALLLFSFGACSSTQPGGGSPLCRIRGEGGQPVPGDFTGTIGRTRRTSAGTGVVLATGVRSACCEKFDRVVFEFAGNRLPSYTIEYVDRPIRQCGSGEVVQVAGDAWLKVLFQPSQAHTNAGQPTITNRNQRVNCPNLKQLVQICDFEGQVEWVLGMGSPNHYRAVELKNPTRLVIDIQR